MVHYSSPTLDTTFAALADPTRRAMLTRLAEAGELAVGELAAPFAMSLPAVLKHVNVLVGAGLLHRRKEGRTVRCRLTTEPLQDAMTWIAHYEAFWTARLDALADYVEKEPCPPPRTSPASPSRGTSQPRSSASSRRGPKGRR